MNAITIILNIARMFFSLLGIVGVIGIFVFIPIGIVFIAKSSNNQFSEDQKKFKKKKGMLFILLPFILIFGSLIAVIAINALNR